MYYNELKYFLHEHAVHYEEIFVPGEWMGKIFDCRVEDLCSFCQAAKILNRLLPEAFYSKNLSNGQLRWLGYYLTDSEKSDFWMEQFVPVAEIVLNGLTTGNKGQDIPKIEEMLENLPKITGCGFDTSILTIGKLCRLAQINGFEKVERLLNCEMENFLNQRKPNPEKYFLLALVPIVLLKIRAMEDGIEDLSHEALRAIYGEI